MINKNLFYKLTLLISLIAVGQMAQTIYVPSIPIMAHDLIIHESILQGLMASYLLCYGISQLMYGPLSDQLGRKPIIIFGMSIFCIGAILAFISHSLLLMIIACGIQGIGTGVGGVMARTLPRDICNSFELRRANGFLNMGIIISPLLAPIIGGLLSDWIHWRACFIFLLLFSIIVSSLIWIYLPETKPTFSNEIKKSLGFKILLKEKIFNYFLLILIGGLSGIVAFEANGGVLLGSMGMNAREISLLFITPLPGIFFGSWYAGRAVKSFNKLMWYAVISCFIAGILMWLPSWFNVMSVWTLLLPALLFFFGAGMLFPLATTGAMAPYPYLAGTAGALVGGMQNIGSGIIVACSSLLSQNNQFYLGFITFLMSTLIFICWFFLSKNIDI